MRTHKVPFYCIRLNQLDGINLESTLRYDVVEDGKWYKIKEHYTRLRCVKRDNFYKPIEYDRQVHFFGHDIEALVLAAYDRLSHSIANLKNGWEVILAKIDIPESEKASFPFSENLPESAAPTPVKKLAEAAPVKEDATQEITNAFTIYIASAKASDTDGNTLKGAYYAVAQNGSTGEIKEFTRRGKIKALERLNIQALIAVLESDFIPKTDNTIVTVFTVSNAFTRIFSGNLLKKAANSSWKVNGKEIANSDLWKKMSTIVDRMTITGIVADENDIAIQICINHAKQAASSFQ